MEQPPADSPRGAAGAVVRPNRKPAASGRGHAEGSEGRRTEHECMVLVVSADVWPGLTRDSVVADVDGVHLALLDHAGRLSLDALEAP